MIGSLGFVDAETALVKLLLLLAIGLLTPGPNAMTVSLTVACLERKQTSN